MAETFTTAQPTIPFYPPARVRPTARDWRLHSSLLLLTALTTTFAGLVLVSPQLATPEPALRNPFDYVLYLPLSYYYSVVESVRYSLSHPYLLRQAAAFAGSLMAILFSHEMGHYLACRYYGVDATLPYFIPAPPMFLAGTFGAFIKIRSPIPSRRALFDIGLAGPIAGFVVALPLAVIGVLQTVPATVSDGSGIVFNDPLLFRLIANFLGINPDSTSAINPYHMAAWIGLLVTSLNLMPVGQLDGGHGTFAVFGEQVHRIVGRLAFFTTGILAILGFWLHGSPSGFLYTILLGIMLRVRHPQPAVMERLGSTRVFIAVFTLLIFVLCFAPFPITVE
jgi:membrane-associated protease RseP (regulator of RpoE activity)